MDTYCPEPVLERSPSLRAAGMHFGLASLSLRLAALRQTVERDYPMALAIDIVNREAVDGLPPDLTDILHAIMQEAALNAARHSHAAMAQLNIQINGGTVLVSIADDGNGLPFIGVYDLHALQALDAGPRWLTRRVAELGGSLTLESRVTGTRIDIVLPRDVPAREAAAAPQIAAA